ncbi:hypothetical protein N7520_003601 [Penicillium odoratum]|uniref:uncharacterized protein n=1 Tax=Penicillium odoratum TaxID=1167516 RepID=UPI0025494218|nr:uncharacterized protein N7520_003601 [Penicillium odoratum]KAJ5769042.1 hypothetical protein N7520_003601 [Penicillium odoratum]
MHINTGDGRDVNNASRSFASLTQNLEIANALAEEINVQTAREKPNSDRREDQIIVYLLLRRTCTPEYLQGAFILLRRC